MEMSYKGFRNYVRKTDNLLKYHQRVLDLDTNMARSVGQVYFGQLAKTMTMFNQFAASSRLAESLFSVDRIMPSFRLASSLYLANLTPIEFPTIWIKSNFDLPLVKAPTLAPYDFRPPKGARDWRTPEIFELKEDEVTEDQLLLEQFDGLIRDSGLRRVCRKLFADGHYAIAVEKAYVYIEKMVRIKSGQSETYGVDLMHQVFNPDNAIIRLNQLKTRTDKSEQDGYRYFFAGAMMGLRNPRAHEYDFVDSPEQALELLGFGQ